MKKEEELDIEKSETTSNHIKNDLEAYREKAVRVHHHEEREASLEVRLEANQEACQRKDPQLNLGKYPKVDQEVDPEEGTLHPEAHQEATADREGVEVRAEA